MAEQADLALIAEANDVAARELLGRLDQRLPARAIEPLDQRRLDFRLGLAADPPAFELRRDHLGVVDDELIARLEPLRQIGHDAVVQDARRARPPAAARNRAAAPGAARSARRAVRSRRDRCAWRYRSSARGAASIQTSAMLNSRPDSLSSRRLATRAHRARARMISRRVRRHVRLDDLVGILDRLAALDLVDVVHALRSPCPRPCTGC